jgi:hypothetical protein
VLSALLQDILHPSHHLLNVLLQIANKLGLSNKKKWPLGKRNLATGQIKILETEEKIIRDHYFPYSVYVAAVTV